ncbi:MAG TPA: hypothetical protein EYG50_01645 [Cycloclasticus sp.]|nr:hypothetical protein [Cycloclasticus sp.]HIL91448.1 hypothetical protein [Cycloclasticus sp.]
MSCLITMGLAKMDDLSDELKQWLSTRQRLLKCSAAFRDDGGHIMLRREVYDPEELMEPLRSEAQEYFANKSNL